MIPPPTPAPVSQVTWTVRQFATLFVANLTASVILVALVGAAYQQFVGDLDARFTFLVSSPLQFLVLASLLWLLVRSVGGRFDRDLGLIIEVRDAPGIFIGALMLFVLGALATPIVEAAGITDNPQGIADQLSETTGATLLVAVLGAVVAAPILEEVMYRGLLQRALAARFSRRVTFLLTSTVWALAHLFTVEPGTDRFFIKAGLIVGVTFLFGLVLSRLADKDGRLGRAVLTHAGFNLTSMAIGVLAGGG